ncbi:MAG: hypothetical protein K2P80_06795 [Beijerinckiaceae bacterium]|nr:hypothetical protein [Beijerinckiaceae bacterium]
MSAFKRLQEIFAAKFVDERRSLGKKYEKLTLIGDWSNVHEKDAENFLGALDLELITHKGKGHYKAPKSSAASIFLNTTSNGFSIRKEDIVAVGSLYRLHTEFGWPKNLLGLEYDTWAFDLIAKEPGGASNVFLAGEVKNDLKDLERLETYLREHAQTTTVDSSNSGKKLAGIRRLKPTILWLIGPNLASKTFKVVHTGYRFDLNRIPLSALEYKGVAS